MLTSRNEEQMGVVVKTRVGSGLNEAISEPAQSLSETFTVNPDPCINHGDFKRPNEYSFVKSTFRYPNGKRVNDENYWGLVTSWTGYLGGHFTGVPRFQPPDISNAVRNQALDKLYENIRNSEVSFNTTIGEGRETLDLLTAVAKAARKVIRDIKGARKSATRAMYDSAANPLQTVGGLWLSWSVGLKPLIDDVENIRNHSLSEQGPGVQFAAKGRSARSASYEDRYVHSDRSDIVETGTYSHREEFGLVFSIDDLHAFENWRAGLTLRPTLAWELTTLSFVFDYFVNIGQYLQLLEASILNNGISLVHGYHTVGTKHEWWMDGNYQGPHTPYLTESWYWTSSGRNTSKKRKLITAFPSPVRPTVKLPRASTQLLNCAALLSQLIQRR